MEIFNMKLKYIIPSIIACLVLSLASCNNENNVTLLSNIKVSSSYVSIPVEGGRRYHCGKRYWRMEYRKNSNQNR